MMQGEYRLRLGVVGAGAMGRGIAEVAAAAGHAVRLVDASAAAAERALGQIRASLAGRSGPRALAADVIDAVLARITLGAGLDELADCQVVVEAIVEDVQAKQALFGRLEAIVDADCILATNTSSLSVTEIASVCQRPQRVAGWHFFNPVPRMRLVEIIQAVQTAEVAIERLRRLTQTLDYRAVVAQDSPGFVVNHIGRALVNEGLQLLAAQCASHADIDTVLRQCGGFRMGPFQLMDLTGLDVSLPASESIFKQYYGDDRYRPAALARIRLAGGLLGRKSGRGFYDYGTRSEQPPPGDRPSASGSSAQGAVLRWAVAAGTARPDTPVLALLQALGPEGDARQAEVIFCAPLGADLSTTIANQGLDPRKTMAIDPMFSSRSGVTAMYCPATDPGLPRLLQGAFAGVGVECFAISDSPGYIVPRVVASIVNLACEVAEQGIAQPADIDAAVQLALGYPRGPLAWADALGLERVLQVLDGLHATTRDPRYRASAWLRRRAQLGLSLSAPRLRSAEAPRLSEELA